MTTNIWTEAGGEHGRATFLPPSPSSVRLDVSRVLGPALVGLEIRGLACIDAGIGVSFRYSQCW